MKLPPIPIQVLTLVPLRHAGHVNADGSVITEGTAAIEYVTTYNALSVFDGEIDLHERTPPFPALMAGHGVSVAAVYYARGWHYGEHREAGWRYYDEQGDEITWEQFLDCYCERYPDVERPTVTWP
jgi:hypothetical protein